MKMMKVFDCQEMLDDVRTEFFKHTDQGNDGYVAVTLVFKYTDYNKVPNWLLANGAVEGETVLVEHWW